MDDDEPIIDPCFSEDSQDDYGQKVFRKSNSVDKFTIPKILQMEPYTKKEPIKRVNIG